MGALRGLYYNLLLFSKKFEVHFIRVNTGEEEKDVMSLPEGIFFKEIHAKGMKFDPASFFLPIYSRKIMKIGSARSEIQSYIDSNGIDAIFIYTQTDAFALRNLSARVKIADVIDSYEVYYRFKLAASKSPKDTIFSTLMRFLYKFPEAEINKKFNLIVYVSELDKEISRVDNRKKYVYYYVRFPPIEKKKLSGRDTAAILFGSWKHPPNRDGLNAILGSLGKINGKVLIIGPHLKAPKFLPENVSVHGHVPDLESFLSRAKICIVPVWYGAGLQNKVFDSLRCGCKVVSTDFTNKTFGANNFLSESIVISNDLIAATNNALEHYSEKDAANAYLAYEKLYKITMDKEMQLIEKIRSMCEQ